MRSRTEMVTTTFVDSEEDYSDDDDSEEDWRPSASSKNGKKQKQQKLGGGSSAKRGRKRKSSSSTGNKNLKRKPANDDSEDDDLDDASEDDYDYDDFETIPGSSKSKSASLPPKKQFSEKTSSISSNEDTEDTFNLLVYIKDLTESDLNKNNRLCLWRKDNNNLLQKYIRVKTSSEQFLFTSSSVYSSFDDKRISDFHEIKVKSIDSTNRRVQIINPSELQKISLHNSKNKTNSDDDDILSDEQSDIGVVKDKQSCAKTKGNVKKSVPKHDDDEDDDEEEVDEENDEEEDDCDLEGDDDDDIEEYDEADD